MWFIPDVNNHLEPSIIDDSFVIRVLRPISYMQIGGGRFSTAIATNYAFRGVVTFMVLAVPMQVQRCGDFLSLQKLISISKSY